MNSEREADRRLRAWTSEGIDRAPEDVVWAALDEVDRVPQRTARQARFETLALRLRPAAGLLGVAAVVVVATAIVARVAAPDPRAVGAPAFEMADLPTIVLWEDTMPSTWTLDNLVSNPTDVRRIPIRSMSGAELEALPDPDGYLVGRYSNFSGPDAIYMSWAALFESGVLAAEELPFYQHEMESADAWGLGRGASITLGDGGFLYVGETSALMGRPTGVEPIPAQIYLWRDGNLLLAVGGWFDVDEDGLRAVAEGMDQRASALAGAGR